MDLDKFLTDDYQPSPTDTFIHISVIWNLEQYDNELAVLEAAQQDMERRILRTGHEASDSHTTYRNFELMPQQALSIKQARSDRAVEELMGELEEELPQLLEGQRPQAVDFWWYNGDQVEILRYTVPADEE